MKLLFIPIILVLFTQQAPANDPPLYPYPAPGDITLEDIVPAAMDNLRRPGYVPGMQPGEKVLIISDRSVDPLTAEAFYVAAWRLAANKGYPDELVWALIRKGYDTMRNGREFHLTDPNGTDLKWRLDEQMWDRYNELWGDIINNHSPRIHLSDNPDMKGVFVSDHLHSGRIPTIELHIDNGKVVKVTGGGSMGDYLRTAFEK